MRIVMTKNSWGDWSCFVDGNPFKPNKLSLDREDLLLAALAEAGIEVVTHTHWYINGERFDKAITNMEYVEVTNEEG